MKTRFAPFCLFVCIVLGVAAMGANVKLLYWTPLNSIQRKAVLPATRKLVNPSFPAGCKKLDTSCKPNIPTSDLLEKLVCKERTDCTWRKYQEPPVCEERKKMCIEINNPETCINRYDCDWNQDSDECNPKEEWTWYCNINPFLDRKDPDQLYPSFVVIGFADYKA